MPHPRLSLPMINCRNCINWVDESLEQIEADHAYPHIFMGCGNLRLSRGTTGTCRAANTKS